MIGIIIHTILSLCQLPQSQIMLICWVPWGPMGVLRPHFGNRWVMWNVSKLSNCIKNSLLPLSFLSSSICHVTDLIHLSPQSASKGPLRKCLVEVKQGSRICKGKGVERNLIRPRGCEGTICEESRVAVLEKRDPSASSVLTYLTYLKHSLSWPTRADTKPR